MSFAIWPPISEEELKIKAAETLARELEWITQRTIEICEDIKRGLEDCYALLAPIDPGSTLVMSTQRNEKVKGTITRVGTRIVKGSLNLQLRLLPAQTITLSQMYPIHVHALDTIHSQLTESIDLLGLILTDHESPNPRKPDAQALFSTLRVLAESLSSSTALLKGPPLVAPDNNWLTQSLPSVHFSPPLIPNFSFYVTLQECCIVIWMRVLEPSDAPVHFGTKLGLAIGTVRRLEHDEMDIVFNYKSSGDTRSDVNRHSANHRVEPKPPETYENVYVREKVRVDSADPSLISLHAKLGYLSNQLYHARRNLAAVMDIDIDS